jgi:2'-5' RNA ligase
MSDVLPFQFRLFVAILLPTAVKERIKDAQNHLRRAVPKARIGWTRGEQFHLTLKFLGDVEASRVDALKADLGAVAGGFGPLRLRAEGIGFFPSARRPRVVWAGVRDETDQLLRLQSAVETVCAPFSGEPAEGVFTGHVTLGRIKDANRSEGEALVRTIGGMAGLLFGEWTADYIGLMRSELLADGAQHSLLASVHLGESSGS